LIHRDFSFFAGFHEAAEKFLAIDRFPAAIALDDPEFGPLHLLVGRKAGPAIQALAATPNRRSIFGGTRIDNFVLLVTALDATHNFDLGRWRKDSKVNGATKVKISLLLGKSGGGGEVFKSQAKEVKKVPQEEPSRSTCHKTLKIMNIENSPGLREIP